MQNGFREQTAPAAQVLEPNSPTFLDQVVSATAAQRHSADDIHRMAVVAGKSGMFKMTPDQIEILMLLCQAEGIEPVKALAMYDVFNGKPAMKSMYMLARHQASGGTFKWAETTPEQCEAFFAHKVSCPEGLTVRFTIEEAKKAKLTEKDNWKNYAEDMLVWRVVSRGVRRSNPACLFGLDVPEPEESAQSQPTPEAVTQHQKLVDKLAGRRENPKESHPPVSETVAELKAAAVPPAPVREAEPTTEWGRVIAHAVLDFNQNLSAMADANRDNFKLRIALKPKDVIDGVLDEYVANSIVAAARLKAPNGRRSGAMCADVMSWLWEEDSDDVEAAVGRFLGARMTELLATTAPVQTELLAV